MTVAEPTADPTARARRLRAAYRKQVQERWAEWRDRSDEWLRAATFGGLDGLVSNSTLIVASAAATAATGAPSSTVVLTGLLNSVAGAASMAGGEYFSVSVDNERRRNATAEVRRKLRENPDGVHEELAKLLQAKHAHLTHDQARSMADKLWSDPTVGEYQHIAHKLDEWPEDGPSPHAASGASFVSFAAGSLLPVGAYALGSMVPGGGVATVLGASAVGLFGAGALTSRFNQGCWWKLGLKQLALGGAALGLGHAAGLSIAATLPVTAAVGAAAVIGIGTIALTRRYLQRRRMRQGNDRAREAFDQAYFETTGELPPLDADGPGDEATTSKRADGPSTAAKKPGTAELATDRESTGGPSTTKEERPVEGKRTTPPVTGAATVSEPAPVSEPAAASSPTVRWTSPRHTSSAPLSAGSTPRRAPA